MKRPGLILRPFLATSRPGIEAWLHAIGQPWREDSTNRDTSYTRNRLRHELLPVLAEYNPGIQSQLAHLAALARDEEAYWQGELARLLPSLLLPGKAVRGGGRATDTLHGADSLSIEIERLRTLQPALRRRVLRAAAARLGVSLDFEDTERLMGLCGFAEFEDEEPARRGAKLHMEKGLRAERSPRELRLFRAEAKAPDGDAEAATVTEYALPIPGHDRCPCIRSPPGGNAGPSTGNFPARSPASRQPSRRPGCPEAQPFAAED